MKKFILKLCLFFLGSFIVMLFEYLISIQYSNYRTPSNNLIFETSQYPYLNELRTVSGDLNEESKKTIRYITNNKGSRSIVNNEIEIAIIGDSFTELDNLDQTSTIQGNLNTNFNKRTVTIKLNYELNKLNRYVEFLSENYNKPKTVILIIVERNIESLIYNEVNEIHFKDKSPYTLTYSSFLKFINEGFDFPSFRFLKYLFLKEKINPVIVDNLMFLQGEKIKTFSKNNLKQFETSIINLNNQFINSNVNFIVGIIPNKETYHKDVFKNVTDKNMISIDSILRKNQILNINIFEEFKSKENMYDKYDTHLSEGGAKYVSLLFVNKIDSLKK